MPRRAPFSTASTSPNAGTSRRSGTRRASWPASWKTCARSAWPRAAIFHSTARSSAPEKIIEENGGKYAVTKVGHAFITEQMEKTGAIFAGESSAHYYFKATGNAESQVTIMLVVLKVLGELGKPFSEVVKDLQKSFESGEVNFKVSNAMDIINSVKNDYI